MKQPKAFPKVAIITRTKNRPLFLERAVKSVESQTFHNYVHVVLNDGGDNKKVDNLLKKYKSKNRVVIHNKRSVGLIRALNQGIQAVDSEYVTILDDDDSWPAERLEKTVSYLESTNDKAVTVKMETVIEELRGDKINFISQELHPESGEGEINLFKQCHKNYISNGIVAYRREVYEELGGYDESLETAEDWDFGLRLLMKYDVSFLKNEKPLFFYHQRPNQQGIEGNSVHAGVYQQEKTINKLRNRYLRNDLDSGKLGVGYIMNLHAHDATMAVRLERHVNNTTKNMAEKLLESIKADIQAMENRRYTNRLKRLVRRRIK